MTAHVAASMRVWANTLLEPLIPTVERLGAEHEMARLWTSTATRELVMRYFSGVIGDLVFSFDPADPWLAGFLRPGFGTVADTLDILSPSGRPTRQDSGLAALSQGLNDSSRRVLAAAAAQARRGVCELLHAGGISLTDVRQALAWAMHRRRAYLGFIDPYPEFLLHQWIRWSAITTAPELAQDEADDMLARSLIEEGSWERFRC